MITESVIHQALAIVLSAIASIGSLVWIVNCNEKGARYIASVGLAFFAGATAILYTNLSKEAGKLALTFVDYAVSTTLLVLAIFWAVQAFKAKSATLTAEYGKWRGFRLVSILSFIGFVLYSWHLIF